MILFVNNNSGILFLRKGIIAKVIKATKAALIILRSKITRTLTRTSNITTLIEKDSKVTTYKDLNSKIE